MDPVKLEELRRRFEALQGALSEEYYESVAGLKAESNLAAIYRRYEDVLTRQAVDLVHGRLDSVVAAREAAARAAAEIAAKKAAADTSVDPGAPAGPAAAPPPSPETPAVPFALRLMTPGTGGIVLADPATDPDEERRLRYLREAQVEEFAGKEVKSILDEVLTRESSSRIKIAAGPGATEEIGFRKATSELANSRDRARREAVEQASLGVVEKLTPLLAERIGIERGIARSFGHETYTALWEAVAGIDLRALDRLMQGFLARTADMYREAMGWMVRKRLGLPLEDARRHDLLWLFRGEDFDDLFPKGEMVPTAKRFLEDMGVDVAAGGNIKFDLEPRERKSARAFCAALDVPRRVTLVLQPEGGRRDWQHFLHELGHALHYGYTSPEEPFEFRRLGDASLTGTYAFLLQYLLIDAGWLKRYLGVGKAKSFLFLANLEKLTYVRRYAAKLHYELALHGRDEGGVEGLPELYEETLAGALRLRYPKELFLYDVDRSFYVARFLRAWLFEALLSKHLVHYFDEDWFRNPRTGQFLKRHWALGQRFQVEEMAKEIGYGALDTAALEQELVKAL